MKIENVEVYGFRAALRGMRNPKESWDKSDTIYDPGTGSWKGVTCAEGPVIGPEDLKLARNLIRGGGAHRKFLRQIMVWWDITIPRDMWQELDTYKVGTVRDSCSTMHKLGHRDLVPDDFQDGQIDLAYLELINILGKAYRDSGMEDYDYVRRMKRMLPEGFLQKATYSFSYETGLKMFYDRQNHRLPEWSGPGGICEHLQRLPYMMEFIGAMSETKARG